MELLRVTSALGIVVFLGSLGWNMGDKMDTRTIDYLITVGGVLLAFLILVAAGVLYAIYKARMANEDAGYIQPRRQVLMSRPSQALPGPGPQSQYSWGSPNLLENQGSFVVDQPEGWSQ